MSIRFSDDLNCKFVSIYKEHECLWKVDSKQYRIKQCRDRAIANIKQRMGMPGLNEHEVKKKIKSLRSTYLQEVKKIKDSIKAGDNEGGDIYKPKIRWFNEMHSFIKYIDIKRLPGPETTMTESTDNNSDVDESTTDHIMSEEPDMMTTINNDQKSTPPTPIKRNKDRFKELKIVLTDMRNPIEETPTQKQPDEFDLFGQYIASQLRLLSLEQGILARENIQAILTQSRLQDLKNEQTIDINSIEEDSEKLF